MNVRELIHGLLKAEPEASIILPIANPEGGDDLELPLTHLCQRQEDGFTVVELSNPVTHRNERPMTVRELIQTLQGYHIEAEVVLLHDDQERREMRPFELTMVHQSRNGDQVRVELFNPMACGY